MSHDKTEQAAQAAAVSLIVMFGGIACMLPPLLGRFVDSPLLMAALTVTITVSMVLHFVFVGILAKSLGRSAGWYVTLALFTLPIGSIVGLVLVEWSRKLNRPARKESAA